MADTTQNDAPPPPTAPEADFSLDLKHKSFTIKEAGGEGKVRTYAAWELTGPERDRYITFVTGRLKGVTGGGTVLRDQEGLQANLICRAVEDDAGRTVSAAFVNTWPSSVQEKVFKLCQQLSGLGATAEEDAKND
jgi:hypothetical protein